MSKFSAINENTFMEGSSSASTVMMNVCDFTFVGNMYLLPDPSKACRGVVLVGRVFVTSTLM